MTRSVVIVAGGKGLRMGSDVPKQFLILDGRPVLMHTIEAFDRFDPEIQIILVLPEEQQSYWKELCCQYHLDRPHEVINGGETRFHSVKNGLALVPAGAVVAIHDGVRPLVSNETITRCFDTVLSKGAVFPVVPVVDTLRKKTASGSMLVNRNDYFLVQTPQVFLFDVIKNAYDQEFSETFTDDVSVVEALGAHPVYEVEGDRNNIKITTPVDLEIAKGILRTKS